MINLLQRQRTRLIQPCWTRLFSENFPRKPLEGQTIPDITLKARDDSNWVDINLHQRFAGKRVVLFALPGAFTPTCSSTHLPGYVKLAKDIKASGIDEICCVSVNDGFVMNSWKKDQNVADEVLLLPDGNVDFTKGVGMDCDKSAIGFGTRSWRYSMVIKDNKIEKVFSEPVKEGDPFEVSDAETMLAYLKVN